MAITSSYYLNAPSLGSATSVFSDAGLTTFATDGFYSDGVISREQVSGVLLPQQTCPSCVSYNCVDGTCTDPLDGTGTYPTLVACQAACFPVSYNCVEGTCTDPGDGTGTYATLIACEADCSGTAGYEYRLYGYAVDTADACGQTGTYVSLGSPELTVWSSSPTLAGVTIFYNVYPPLSSPYINGAIGNGDRILFALASNTAEKWTGSYNNTTGAISGNSDCTP